MMIQAISGFGGKSQDKSTPSNPQLKDIYIKIRGQSNAGGRVYTSSLTPEELEASYYNDIYIWQSSDHDWRPYYPQGTKARTSDDMFGVEAFLAVKLRDYYNDGRKVLIDKYTAGGTALGVDSTRSDWNISSNQLWLGNKEEYTEAMTRISSNFFNPDYKLFLWWQGENDSLDQDMSNAYKQNFRDIWNDEKTFVSKPNLYYVDVEISDQSGPYYTLINSSKQENVTYFGNSSYIPVLDLDPDVHVNTAQMRIVADRIFDQVKDLWK